MITASQPGAAAERAEASTFRNSGYVVSALQAAWSAISRTPVPAISSWD